MHPLDVVVSVHEGGVDIFDISATFFITQSGKLGRKIDYSGCKCNILMHVVHHLDVVVGVPEKAGKASGT